MRHTELIARADAVLERVALAHRRDMPAAALSHGDQRKLEVALMIALEPKIFMFDEPTAGMSVDEVPVVLDLIAQLKQDTAKIILLVEHKMDVVRSLADRIIVLHNGKLVADGKPAEVIASPVVQEAYLGSVRREGRMSALLTLSGVETHIGRYHILHGVELARAGRRAPRCCSAATARARPRRLRTIMGLWRASSGEIRLGGARIEALGTPDIARAGIGYVPETHGGVLRPHREGEPGPGGARRRDGRDAPRLDFRLLPAAEEVLAFARRHALGRAEADALVRARA